MNSTPKNFPNVPKDAARDYNDSKIAIIGAGATGLFAANALKYMGVNANDFVVYEASGRVGGRLKSTDDFHDVVPLDIGAEWIHSSNEDVVKNILVFPEHVEDGDGHVNIQGLEPSEFIKFNPEWHFRSNKARIMKILYQETKWKRSTWWHYIDKYVYRHVQDNVKFNSPVKEITYNADNPSGYVKLVMEDGAEHTVDKVICTIPLGVLKKKEDDDGIKFNPPLPLTKRKAIDSMEFKPGFRILFEMKEKFYPELTLDNNGIIEQLKDFDDLTAVYDPLYGKDIDPLASSKHILAYVAIGENKAGEMSRLNEEELAKAALANIDKLFDGQGTKNYIKHLVQNWTLEPYILGAYTGASSTRSDRLEVGRTIGDGRLLFAGEHTSAEFFSLVPGAALEGRRAAMEAVMGDDAPKEETGCASCVMM
mmetsp:Transcript_10283/g.15041  ORF Transcript_10283/g.15041 Transcript_10283/m.15041 type:complete len:423 (-) Transcript_10283:80-1348(-)|eukprot:CAMPEP_0197246388 /NCGR_PEP_ID=MMETSP1429-20130617/10844_1 /TAXON_ID=49237 /ORGANISM="Chaetoceros  sp., Strain UNC1202" /LENGTH=422 /DNA_ID=CAMNT_0042707023 /DNA_START=145 /DNA_END=1413 /DNA_ORIENTATION=+